MRFIIIFISLLLPLDTDAIASDHHVLTCEEFEYLSEGLEEVEDLEQSIKVELLGELINATDPKCFS